jgi:DNA-binding CsgD family transcriptional regulator
MDSTRLFGERFKSAHLKAPEQAGRNSAQEANLTAFERRALELFATGLPRREIAHALHRAPKTISNSLTMARDKLGARSLAEAAVLLTGSLGS